MNNEKMIKIYYIYSKNKIGIRSININLTLFIIPPTHLEDLFRQQNTKKKNHLSSRLIQTQMIGREQYSIQKVEWNFQTHCIN